MAVTTRRGPGTERDTAALLHLLEVHQAELEVQNSELRAANDDLRRSNEALVVARDRFRSLYEHAPVPYVTVDATGTIVDVNRAGEGILGLPRGSLLGSALQLFVNEASRATFRRFLDEVFARGHERSRDLQLASVEAAPVDVLIEGVALRQEADAPVRCVLALVDITARKVAEQARRQAQDEMLAIVSHDLRGPLNAIALAAETLASGVEPDAQRRCIATIERATGRCERLIRDLLGVAQLESGRLTLQLAPVELGDLVEQACLDHEAAVVAAGSTLRVSSVAGPHVILGDRDRLHQVLSNLILNALVHARGARIDVTVVARDGHGVIAVADDGPGIAADDLPFVFERYRQGANHHGGAGLGLAIVRGLVLAHHGTATVTSRRGHGARFELALPLHERASHVGALLSSIST